MFSFPSWFQSRWSHFIRWRFGCCITENWSYWFSLLLMNHFCLFKQLHIPCSAQFSSALFYETSCICNSFKFLFLFFSLSGLCMLHVFLAGRCDVCYSWFSLKTYYRTDFTTGTTAECNKWIGKTGLCWHDSSHNNYLMDGTWIEMISGQYWCHSWFWYLIFFFLQTEKKCFDDGLLSILGCSVCSLSYLPFIWCLQAAKYPVYTNWVMRKMRL